MTNELVTADGEIIEQKPLPDVSLAIGLTRAEIDTQIATARAWPRSIKRATDDILSLATLDEETAAECMYALPRGGKPIQGPSIRLAEIIQQSWGNCRVAARVVHVDRTEKYVEAEGIYHDLETNSATMARVRRRIVDSKGRIYSDDMIIVTGNAACSIAKRNAILGGVPKPVWRRAYEASQQVVSGTIETLTVTRDKSLKAFANFGVKPEQIFIALGVAGLEDIGLDHIPILRGMFSALKNGEATVEEMFSGKAFAAAGPQHGVIKNPLSDKEPEPKKDEASPPPETASETAPQSSETADSEVLRVVGRGGHIDEIARADHVVGADGRVIKSKNGAIGDVTTIAPDDEDPVNDAQEADPEPSPFFLAGQKAARAGSSRKALPADLRAQGREADAAEWQAGFDAASKAEV